LASWRPGFAGMKIRSYTSFVSKINLQFIVSNRRFLILANVSVRGFASMIHSLDVRHLADDWERLYGYRPLLIETLVERDRFAGTCDKAANWIGHMDREHAAQGKFINKIYCDILPKKNSAMTRLWLLWIPKKLKRAIE
jgi:hypothetical protein